MSPEIEDLVRAAVQTLYLTARTWNTDALLRELKKATHRWKNVSGDAFVIALDQWNAKCAPVGLRLTFAGGQVCLSLAPETDLLLNDWFSSHVIPRETFAPTEARILVAAIVLFKQPVTAADAERICGADRREILNRLVEQDWIERHPGSGRADVYTVTPRFIKLHGEEAIAQIRLKYQSQLQGPEIGEKDTPIDRVPT